MAAPPSVKLASARLKIERAEKHLADLDVKIRAFLKSGPYEIATKIDPDTGNMVPYVSRADDAPAIIALAAGDAIHNLRSALDHLAFQLFLVGPNGTDDKLAEEVSFPIARSAAVFKPGFKRKKQVFTNAVIEVLKSIQPCRGGKGECLWVLHRLNNTDKHRLLLTVGAALFSIGIDASETPIGMSQPRGMVPIARDLGPHSKPIPMPCPLKKDAVLPAPYADVNNKEKITFEIAFGEPGIVEREPVLPFLEQLIEVVNGVVDQFARFI